MCPQYFMPSIDKINTYIIMMEGLLQSFLATDHTLVFCLSLTAAASRVNGKPNARLTVPAVVGTVLV